MARKAKKIKAKRTVVGKTTEIIILAVVVILLMVAGVYWYSRPKTTVPIPAQPQVQTETAPAIPQLEDINLLEGVGVNPFENVQTNPFEDVKFNPFE